MFGMYSNRDVIKRYDAIDAAVGMENIEKFMDEAMNLDGHTSELLWWYDEQALPYVRVIPIPSRSMLLTSIIFRI